MFDAVKDFVKKMDVMFSRYYEDGCLDEYVCEEYDPEFVVGAKDADYVWDALDGAIHIYNIEHNTELCFDQSYNERTGRYHFTISE